MLLKGKAFNTSYIFSDSEHPSGVALLTMNQHCGELYRRWLPVRMPIYYLPIWQSRREGDRPGRYRPDAAGIPMETVECGDNIERIKR